MENPQGTIREKHVKVRKGWIVVVCILVVLATGYTWFNKFYIQGRAYLRDEVLAQIDMKLLKENYSALKENERFAVQDSGDIIVITKRDMTDDRAKTEPLIYIMLYDSLLFDDEEIKGIDHLSCNVQWTRPYWHLHMYPAEEKAAMLSSGIPNFKITARIADANGSIRMFIDPEDLQVGLNAIESELLEMMNTVKTYNP